MSRAILLLPLCASMACYCDKLVFHHTTKPYTTSVYDITRPKHSCSSVISEVHKNSATLSEAESLLLKFVCREIVKEFSFQDDQNTALVFSVI